MRTLLRKLGWSRVKFWKDMSYEEKEEALARDLYNYRVKLSDLSLAVLLGEIDYLIQKEKREAAYDD